MQSTMASKYSDNEEKARLERRQNRFCKNSSTANNRTTKAINDTNQPLIGTCEKLEKNYLRLTSAPNPSSVRPLRILEQAFTFVLNKYQVNHDWSYISDQLRSIRQDLMVQTIRNDFTVLVYEENARLALENNDRDQFIQCQTQLEVLYENGCNRANIIEFLIYRLLYSLLMNDYKKVNRILIEIKNEEKQCEKSNDLSIALDICSAFRRNDYKQFFICYQSLPRLASCLVNLFIDIYRRKMIKILIWGFFPTIPLEIVTVMMVYESNDICREQLRDWGIQLTDGSMVIDCKSSRLSFIEK